jgi:anaerobic C4-dicarboxylate transporter
MDAVLDSDESETEDQGFFLFQPLLGLYAQPLLADDLAEYERRLQEGNITKQEQRKLEKKIMKKRARMVCLHHRESLLLVLISVIVTPAS